MELLVLVLHVLVGAGVIGLVLLQHGKGADMGAAFGSGSAGSLFGASGSANFLSRATAILAAIFFLTSLGLTYLSSSRTETKGVIERSKSGEAPKSAPETIPPTSVPAAPGPVAPAPDGSKAGEVPK
ncbi:MAG: preprotein translocase subunit SecG [Burkholderiales bacterium]|nr:preprotein translocase subunit SecG [Burkholderiales bacterium]